MAIDTKINLCDTCQLRSEFPICLPDTLDTLRYGDGENIIDCPNYDSGNEAGSLAAAAKEAGAEVTEVKMKVVLEETPEENEAHFKARIASYEPPYAKQAAELAVNRLPTYDEDEEPIVISRASATGTAVITIEPEKDLSVIALYNEGVRLKEFADNRIIAGAEGMKDATKDLSIIAGVTKSMEAKKDAYTGPIKAHLAAFNTAFKTFMAPLTLANTITREKMKTFDIHIEQERLKAEKLNRDALDVARRQAEANSGEFTVNIEPVFVLAAAPQTIRTDMGTAGKRDNWKAKVVNFALLPDDYKLADMQTLNAKARSSKGTATIPGVEFYNDQGYTVRARQGE
ncbi:MAG: hypothetical protein U1D67_04845 [Dehalococcoidia bacterium]|nr:hypothetical protein [Dehalococcoidia bacterium]